VDVSVHNVTFPEGVLTRSTTITFPEDVSISMGFPGCLTLLPIILNIELTSEPALILLPSLFSRCGLAIG